MERLGFVPEPDPQQALSFARQFLRLWGSLAIGSFLIAAFLTYYVTRVIPFAEDQIRQFGIYGQYKASQHASGSVAFFEAKEDGGRWDRVWEIAYPSHTTDILVPNSLTCHVSQGDEGSYRTLPKIKHKVYAMNLAGFANDWSVPIQYYGDLASEREVRCDGPPLASRASFSRFVLPIQSPDPYPIITTPGAVPAAIHLSAVIEDAEALQIYGGRSESSNQTLLQANDLVQIRYTDARLESRREALFVVVGALIALGAAMALECLRPFVEFSARRRLRQGQQ